MNLIPEKKGEYKWDGKVMSTIPTVVFGSKIPLMQKMEPLCRLTTLQTAQTVLYRFPHMSEAAFSRKQLTSKLEERSTRVAYFILRVSS